MQYVIYGNSANKQRIELNWIIWLTVSKRFPGIVLIGWTQLFSVACGILKLLLKLPYFCSIKNCTATRWTVLLACQPKPFHVNTNNASLGTGEGWWHYFSFRCNCDSFQLRNNTTLDLFCFCGESSSTVLAGLKLTLRIYQRAVSRIGYSRFPSGCLIAILRRWRYVLLLFCVALSLHYLVFSVAKK